jgi:signal transduction histidine kinase
VDIRDSGAGIVTEDQSQIFDPFFTTKAAGKGTGLGLSTAKSIVTSHGGEILCDSQPPKGTTFTVRLPFHQAV